MKTYIDGKEWLETDYLSVFKDLTVYGDFTLYGGGSQVYDSLIHGSFKVFGVSAFGSVPAPTAAHTLILQAPGTAVANTGLQIRAPTGFKGHYFEVLRGTSESNILFFIGTGGAKLNGTLTADMTGTFKGRSWTRGSFTGIGSFTRAVVYGSAYIRYAYGSVGSYTRMVGGGGSVAVSRIGSVERLWGSFRATDRLGSLTFVIKPAGTAQGRIGMGRNVYLGSLVDAVHMWSTGAEFRLRQAYGQMSRLWVDQAVLNVSKSNFGSPFAAAMSITPGSSNKIGLEVWGTKSQTANIFKVYRNSAGSLCLTVGTQYYMRAYGTARLNRVAGTAYFNRAAGTFQGRFYGTLTSKIAVGGSVNATYPLYVKGSAYIRMMYGSFGSFTRLSPTGGGSFGSFTRLAVDGISRARGNLYGSLGSFTRVTTPTLKVRTLGSLYSLAVQGTARFYGPTTIPTTILTGASSEMLGSFSGDAQGTASDPWPLAADGSYIYIGDNSANGRVFQRAQSNWAYATAYTRGDGAQPMSLGMVRLDPAGARGSYVYAGYKGTDTSFYGKIVKLKVSDFTKAAELNGSWGRASGGYGTFGQKLSGIVGYKGTVFVLDSDNRRILKIPLSLGKGTVFLDGFQPKGAGTWNTDTSSLATDGTYILMLQQSATNLIRKYDIGGNYITQIGLGSTNEPAVALVMKGNYFWVTLYNTIASHYSVEKHLISNLSKLSEFNPSATLTSIANNGSYLWVSQTGAPTQVQKWSIGGDSTLQGAAITMTFGSFAELSAGASRLYGTIRGSKYFGTTRIYTLGGTAKPGSAGYIVYPRAFTAPPHRGVSLTQKDPWDPVTKYGPRIKQVAAGSMRAMGSPNGYMWWMAAGSAF